MEKTRLLPVSDHPKPVGFTWAERTPPDGPWCIRVPALILGQLENLGLTAWRVLIGLWAFWGSWDSCRPSRKTLADFLGASLDTVDRGLAELAARDYVLVESRPGQPHTFHKGNTLLLLQSPYLDLRLMGMNAVLGDADVMAAGPSTDPIARRARRRLKTLGCPSLRVRETWPGLRFGPHQAWIPLTVLAKAEDLNVTEWQTLLGLYAFWQQRELCYPRQRILARLLRCHVKRVARAIAGLRNKGYLEVQQRMNHSAVYHPGPKLRLLEESVLLSEGTAELVDAKREEQRAEEEALQQSTMRKEELRRLVERFLASVYEEVRREESDSWRAFP